MQQRHDLVDTLRTGLERRADLPDRIAGPELSKGGEVTLVDGVGVARLKIADGKLVFDCLQTFFQRSYHFAPINCSNETFDIRTRLNARTRTRGNRVGSHR